LAANQSLEDLMLNMDSVRNLLSAMGLELSAGIVKEIQAAVLAHSDLQSRVTLFKRLQIATEEFATTPYRKRCFDYVSRISRAGMHKNPEGVRAAVNYPHFAEIQKERTSAFTVLSRLSTILEKGASNSYESILGLSFSYANIVDGVYKRSVQDCYVIDELSDMRTVDLNNVQHYGVGKILQEYNEKGKDTTIFEGWDDVVRNAVAHVRIEFDEASDKMTYIDKIATRTRASVYAFNELQEKYNKLFDVFSLVLIRNQMWRISDMIFGTPHI
jgi:hypothetical protein